MAERLMKVTPQHQTVESGASLVAKVAPPASVSLATVAGYQISELVLWATLIYTVLMIVHKLITMYRDLRKD
jgi:hypothetical protein